MVEEQQVDMIAEAKAAAEELRKLKEENEVILKKMQELKTQEILGGKSVAGSTQAPVMSKADEVLMNNKDAYKGTALEGYFK